MKKLKSNLIDKVSSFKQEPLFMKHIRIKALESFNSLNIPNFGPKLNIDFDKINYFHKVDDQFNDWEKMNSDLKQPFEELGLLKAEKDYLGGIGVQYESTSIYHNMLSYLEEKGVIFVDTDTALKKYPELFKKYFSKLIPIGDNKFSDLNTAFWSGGAFIYVPKGVKLDRPLQSYFWINNQNFGQFERTIIIVDEGAQLEYIEGCTARKESVGSLHAGVVEIFVHKNAKCRYTTIQNWSTNIYNLVTKRALVEEDGLMEWIDGNIGSKITMKYPACILKGKNARGLCLSISLADKDQIQDAGAKMIHLGPNTKSKIVSKSIARNGGNATYRGTVHISKEAVNSMSTVKCDTFILDSLSKSDTFPTNIVSNKSSLLEHEATVSKISEDELFYLMSKGIDEEKAKELIILGFIEEFKSELPLEYAVELNNLLKNKY